MQYRNTPHSGDPFLERFVQNIYELKAEREYVYAAVPNGEIGSVILQGGSHAFRNVVWEAQPRVSV